MTKPRAVLTEQVHDDLLDLAAELTEIRGGEKVSMSSAIEEMLTDVRRGDSRLLKLWRERYRHE